MKIDEIKALIDQVEECRGVPIPDMPNNFAFKMHGQYFIGVHREHGSWPLSERNIQLALLDALHEPTRFTV
jgi:hypothetical protein